MGIVMTRKERRKMMRQRKKEHLKLTDKKHPKEAVYALLLGVLSVIILFMACMKSSETSGKGGIEVGIAGLVAAFASALGFAMAAKSLKQDGIRYFFPTVASILNGIMLVFYVYIYFWGAYV